MTPGDTRRNERVSVEGLVALWAVGGSNPPSDTKPDVHLRDPLLPALFKTPTRSPRLSTIDRMSSSVSAAAGRCRRSFSSPPFSQPGLRRSTGDDGRSSLLSIIVWTNARIPSAHLWPAASARPLPRKSAILRIRRSGWG
jgi:hypothetical protein